MEGLSIQEIGEETKFDNVDESQNQPLQGEKKLSELFADEVKLSVDEAKKRAERLNAAKPAVAGIPNSILFYAALGLLIYVIAKKI